jgi:hypothetical protein
MFEFAQRASEAMAEAGRAGSLERPQMPAMAGCHDCGTTQIIAAPVLGPCPGCGGTMSVLETDVSANLI